MTCAAVVLVETHSPGNLGSVLRAAASFGVPRVHLVRPMVEPTHPEVADWACGGEERLDIVRHDDIDEAVADYRTVAATASARGRSSLPVLSPAEAMPLLTERGLATTAIVFGNERRGLATRDLDRCDLVLRLPTRADFPVLNLAQAVAAVLALLASNDMARPALQLPEVAGHQRVEQLVADMRRLLLAAGYLDPANPQRMMRRLRLLIGRAGLSEPEVDTLLGICRQLRWAVSRHASSPPPPP